MTKVQNNGQPTISLKLAQNYRVISCAYHEAAHTICGLLYYMQITNVEIYEKKTYVEGATFYETFYNDTHYEQIDPKIKEYLLLSEICLKYSGLGGEQIYFKDLSGSDNFLTALKVGTAPDFREAADIIKKYNLAEPGQKRYLFKQKMFRKTKKLLQEYWVDIKMLAHALYEKRKLQEEDIRQLLTKKSPNKRFWKKQFSTIASLFSQLDNSIVMHIIETTT